MSWIQSDFQYTEPEPYIPPTWADGTDEEIVTALEKHYAGEINLTEYWSVGDTRTVSLSAMPATNVGETHAAQDVVFVISHVGGKTLADGSTTCAFQVDQLGVLKNPGYMNYSSNNSGGWKNSKRRAWCNNEYKNAIPSTLLPIFKEFNNYSGTGGNSSSGVENTTDTFALRAEIEVFGTNSNSVNYENTEQITWYKTSSNRNKTSVSYRWWERSPKKSSAGNFCIAGSSASNASANSNYYLAPFGVI